MFLFAICLHTHHPFCLIQMCRITIATSSLSETDKRVSQGLQTFPNFPTVSCYQHHFFIKWRYSFFFKFSISKCE
jgi:hypothetical protein